MDPWIYPWISISTTSLAIWSISKLLVKVKVKSSTCYSAFYMRRTQYQKRFTILEVAADWHGLMIPQRSMRPSIARVNEQVDPRFAAVADIPSDIPISYTRPSPP